MKFVIFKNENINSSLVEYLIIHHNICQLLIKVKYHNQYKRDVKSIHHNERIDNGSNLIQINKSRKK